MVGRKRLVHGEGGGKQAWADKCFDDNQVKKRTSEMEKTYREGREKGGLQKTKTKIRWGNGTLETCSRDARRSQNGNRRRGVPRFRHPNIRGGGD